MQSILNNAPRTATQGAGQMPPRLALLALDFDGVLTDDRVIVSQDGTESVVCSRADGLGIALLKEAGLPVEILSTETNPVVAVRAKKLGVPVRQGLTDKAETLRVLARESNIELHHVMYVGNDVNDAGCLALAGCAVVPADAHPRVRQLANIILTRPGGYGAVRELVEMILTARRNGTTRLGADV